VFASDAKLEKIATGFSNVAGLTSDEAGHIYFTDAAMHKIYRWNSAEMKAELLTDKVPTPMAAGYAGNGTLLVQDYARAVYSVDTKCGETKKLEGVSTPPDGTTLLVPIGFHNSIETLRMQMERRGVVYAGRSNMAISARVTNEPRNFYYGPGSTVAIMAGGNWQPELQASQWGIFRVGDEHLVASEEDDTLYQVKLDSLQHVTTSEFAPRGGSSVVMDTAGNIYVAEGHLYIYNQAGKQIGLVEIPERPSSLAFGGADNKTLYLGARGSLYALKTANPGK